MGEANRRGDKETRKKLAIEKRIAESNETRRGRKLRVGNVALNKGMTGAAMAASLMAAVQIAGDSANSSTRKPSAWDRLSLDGPTEAKTSKSDFDQS